MPGAIARQAAWLAEYNLACFLIIGVRTACELFRYVSGGRVLQGLKIVEIFWLGKNFAAGTIAIAWAIGEAPL